jgi:hypothetical protein
MRRARRVGWLRQWIAVVGFVLLFGCILGAANSSGAHPYEEVVLMLGANVGMVLVISWWAMRRTPRYRA